MMCLCVYAQLFGAIGWVANLGEASSMAHVFVDDAALDIIHVSVFVLTATCLCVYLRGSHFSSLVTSSC